MRGREGGSTPIIVRPSCILAPLSGEEPGNEADNVTLNVLAVDFLLLRSK